MQATNTHAAFEFVVDGRVQGVFFRKNARAKARALALTGWVQNDPTLATRVLGRAEGPPAALSQFREWLSVGPPGSKVEGVAVTEVPATSHGGGGRRDV